MFEHIRFLKIPKTFQVFNEGFDLLYKYFTLSTLYLVWFGLVWFYGIPTIVGYLMSNPFYTYVLNK